MGIRFFPSHLHTHQRTINHFGVLGFRVSDLSSGLPHWTPNMYTDQYFSGSDNKTLPYTPLYGKLSKVLSPFRDRVLIGTPQGTISFITTIPPYPKPSLNANPQTLPGLTASDMQAVPWSTMAGCGSPARKICIYLGPKSGSHIPTLRPKYIPYSYMDPLGMEFP